MSGFDKPLSQKDFDRLVEKRDRETWKRNKDKYKKLTENLLSGKYTSGKGKGSYIDAMRDAGFSESTVKRWKSNKPIKYIMDSTIKKLGILQDKSLERAIEMSGEAGLRDSVYAVSETTKLKQLLEGKPTENVNILGETLKLIAQSPNGQQHNPETTD